MRAGGYVSRDLSPCPHSRALRALSSHDPPRWVGLQTIRHTPWLDLNFSQSTKWHPFRVVGKDRAETNDPSHSLRESKSTLISSGTRMRNFLFRENVSDGFPEIDDDEKAPTLTWILNDYASREVDGNRQRWSCASPSSSSDSNWITHHRRCSFVLHILREGRPFPPFLLCQLCKIHHGWKEIVKRMSISVACRKKRRWIENSLLPAYNPPTLLNH